MEEEKEEDMERTQRAREGGRAMADLIKRGGRPTDPGRARKEGLLLFLGLRVSVGRERRPG